MDVTMNYVNQEWWTWWFAVYLFFGGLGAALMAVAFLTDMYYKKHPTMVIWATISSFIMLGAGSSMLFIHLLDHLAVVHVLNPLVLLNKPDAWIAWGTQFITWMMVWGALYPLPYFIASPTFQRLPIIGPILRLRLVHNVAGLATRYHKLLGWLATVNGIGVAVYTGLLLQSFPAVALWHNPGVPVLFTLSAFSTALAFLLVVLYVFIRSPADHNLRVFYERTDVILIAAELVVLFSFWQYLQVGPMSAQKSFALLWNDLGWLIGFIGFGLLVPFFLELKGVIKGWSSGVPIVFASVLVLIGGYLLRHYFMYAGTYSYPW